MWIQVRTMDGRKNVRIDDLSKLTKIEELREMLVEPFEAEVEKQRLFYRGKQLEDGHTLFDYDVGLNEIVQLLIRNIPVESKVTASDQSGESKAENEVGADGDDMDTTEATSNGKANGGTNGKANGKADSTNGDANGGTNGHAPEGNGEAGTAGQYKVGDKVDAKDRRMGAWFEALVVKVTTEPAPSSSSGEPDSETTTQYHVKFDDYSDDDPTVVTSDDVRTRARYRLQWEQVSVGTVAMVNYNPDAPKERGFWYDAEITRKVDKKKEIYCKLILGSNADASEEVKLHFTDELFRIDGCEGAETNGEEGESRTKKPDCDMCKDNPRRKCKSCACSVCGGKNDPDKQILCDECDQAYHLWCLSTPLQTVPEEDEWYCPDCKTDKSEVIGAGEKMKMSKKKANMVSNKRESSRDWGKGMACVGRTKVCTIVPSNHFGPIPGVPIGSMWKFRVQVSESGVHRPHVAGIHGREDDGAYSIVLSGGYDDDQDNGEEFTYSGSGGRDLSGNKRTAKQSMDQKLTAMNRALARTCDCPLNDKTGGSARKWTNSKPVRVVRNYKGRKSSEYAPEEGNRYDGIYKVVKYWPEKNKNGFIVWKYLFRRDDESHAPWTREGKKAIKKLGLTMEYPDGYLEAQAAKKQSKEAEADDGAGSEEEEADNKGKRGRKRKAPDSKAPGSPAKKSKQPRYELSKGQRSLIKADTVNSKVWEELLASAKDEGSAGLLSRIQETFNCIVCQEVVYQPVTTTCSHNICKTCLSRSFKVDVYSCPNCRHDLGKDYAMTVNKSLQAVLLDLFPGYNGGR